MPKCRDVVITGVGAVTSLGIGTEILWKRLCAGESGIAPLPGLRESPALKSHPELTIGGTIPDFDPKAFVRPRKALKVMCRELTTAYAASQMAFEAAGVEAWLESEAGDRSRVGTVFGSEMLYGSPEEMASTMERCRDAEGHYDIAEFGEAAMREMYPLWMLRYLPNMAACHVGIAIQAFGPNNTVVQGEASGLAALVESSSVIERGLADVMLSGGTGDRVSTSGIAYHRDHPCALPADPWSASALPYHPASTGVVNGEGAASLTLESAQACRERGGTPLATVRGWASRFVPSTSGRGSAAAVALAVRDALAAAAVEPASLSLIVSHAMGDAEQDAAERQGLAEVVPQALVYAPIVALGHCGAGVGAVNAAIAVLATSRQRVPPTLNAERLPDDPGIRVTRELTEGPFETVLCFSHTPQGQAVAIVLGRP